MTDKHEFYTAQSIFMQINWNLGFGNFQEWILFSKFQNGELNQDGVSNHCFFLLALTQSFFNQF
jgi:hypothetical protein